MTSASSALVGQPNALGFGRAESMIVVLVDGLGAQALREFSGHARTLRSGDRRGPISATFPSTTAAGLASLCTGIDVGGHGFVGYQAYDEARDCVVNILSGWGPEMIPEVWQPQPTVFERAVQDGVDAVALGRRRYARSGLTRALLRGARYVEAGSIAERFRTALSLANAPGPRLVYLYVSELDELAHSRGYRSDEWVEALEAVDSELGSLVGALGPGRGVVVTADHGIVDVAHEEHVIFGGDADLVRGIRHVSGEPRCLQLIVTDRDPAVAVDVAAAWSEREEGRAEVFTQAEAVERGLFGSAVSADARTRLGDVLVAATASVAYYVDEADRSRGMVGQHGSLTDAEQHVPLITYGSL